LGFGAEMLTAGVMALVLSAVLGEHWALPHAPEVWWAWGYLVVFGSLIAFSAYRFVVERVSPTLAATYAYVNPPVALVVGWWLGNESFSANVLLGLPIVLVAVALLAWIQTRPTTSRKGAASAVPVAAALPQNACD
jgi:drug/metabolite transporter (DMT)-like permease